MTLEKIKGGFYGGIIGDILGNATHNMTKKQYMIHIIFLDLD
jgi:ADP-ribosylglycohydrolase